MTILAKVVENYRAAAAKFDEARKVGKSEVVSKYLDLMSQAYQKRADSEDARRKAVALVVDKSIQSEDELHKKQRRWPWFERQRLSPRDG